MNEKNAKSLRRIAEAFTVGMPKIAYVTDRNGTRRLDPRCTRGVYQKLKRKFNIDSKRVHNGHSTNLDQSEGNGSP